MLNVRQNGAGLYKYCGARRCGGDQQCYKIESILVIGNRRWRRWCKFKVWSICICLLIDIMDLSENFASGYTKHHLSYFFQIIMSYLNK